MDYLSNQTASPPSSLEVDIRRIITFPGQALAPGYGRMKINKLRERARQELGECWIIAAVLFKPFILQVDDRVKGMVD